MINLLKDALQNLAAPADEQIEYLEELGTAPSANELALEFDGEIQNLKLLVADGLLSEDAYQQIKLLDVKLSRMSDNKNIWSCNALRTNLEWEQVRQLGKYILNSLNSAF